MPSYLSCAACEERLADVLDGVLTAAMKTEVEAHLAGCAACAELLRDAGGAMHFMERASAVEVPATLVPQILAEITTGPSRVLVQASLTERIFGRWIRAVLQPRFALGLAMAALSIAFVPRPWLPLVATPSRILTIAENRIYRTFDRAMKSYDNLAVVADVQNQIQDQIEALRDRDADRDPNEGTAAIEGGQRQ
jgi:anti-sigma factor RsiW